uniref:Nephrocystin 3 helical domain-containing protein n=1 Tax=Ciona intestinalis TaxID=7719 RepID=H2XNY3_CIOIN
ALNLGASSYEAHTKKILFLQFITCSKDGLSECEILSLLPDLTWYNLCTISKELTKFFILKQQGGLLIAHNSEVCCCFFLVISLVFFCFFLVIEFF